MSATSTQAFSGAPPTDSIAQAVAEDIMAGFDGHFAQFRAITSQARALYASASWLAARDLVRARIDLYDQRVGETTATLRERFRVQEIDRSLWQDVKLRYMGLLYEHRQPELAETFYNSVFCKLFERHYYHNDNIFVRPALSTDYIEGDAPVYRSYYPASEGLRPCIEHLLRHCGLDLPFEDLERDVQRIAGRWEREIPPPQERRRHFQLHVLTSPFFRNKAAYLVGRVVNGAARTPFIVPLLTNGLGEVYVDSLITRSAEVASLFSFARAYFLVDTDVPSAVVRFLLSIQPAKCSADMYTAIGFHKHGKTQFYRDFLQHLRLSDDLMTLAPGTPGMVMLVFTLGSYPYVFKVIRDAFRPPKDTSPEQVKAKYRMVKLHDRVGRMADTWEYSYAAFPRERFTPELLEELQRAAPSALSFEDDQVVIKHLYIERRLMPLNVYLDMADDAQLRHLVREYGDAVTEIAAAGIFPGDLLSKNFGVTAHGRVIFYDYDEIVPMLQCRFRAIPPPRYPEDELASEPWYSVEPDDVFPEEFGRFLLTRPRLREIFVEHHAQLLRADWWQGMQDVIRSGGFPDVFPYPAENRFQPR